MYRDHRKGPGGPPGGATYPGGPRGLKWEGNQPLVGWAPPMGLPPAPRVGNPRVGGAPLALGGKSPPLAAAPSLDGILAGAPPPRGAYIKGGGRAVAQQPWAPPSSPATPLPLAEARRSPAETRYIHHHAVVLLDLHQPLLSPCWIKKEETSLHHTCVERGGAVRSALGHR